MPKGQWTLAQIDPHVLSRLWSQWYCWSGQLDRHELEAKVVINRRHISSLRAQHLNFGAFTILALGFQHPGTNIPKSHRYRTGTLLFSLCPMVTYNFIIRYLHCGFRCSHRHPPLTSVGEGGHDSSRKNLVGPKTTPSSGRRILLDDWKPLSQRLP